MTSRVAVVLLAAVLAASCAQPHESYAPGLGEIMTLQQMRHTKLWLAGEAANWPLAAYELDELDEGFEDAVHFHPTHKDSPVPIKEVVERIMTQPLKDVRAAVDARNPAAFATAFDAVTDGCNRCHKATNFGFNAVTRPAANPYPNQVFAVPVEPAPAK